MITYGAYQMQYEEYITLKKITSIALLDLK